MSELATTPRRARRHDPDRRDRIVDACLDVIGEVGVAGASTRRVAAAADVPLGSITYHFTDVDELLREAFGRFALQVSDRFEQRLGAASDEAAARRAVVDLITDDVLTDPRELVLTHELYTLAARDPGYRRLTHEWMARSRHALERHFDPTTARILDALVEGLTIHRALDTEPHGRAEVERAVALVAGGADRERP
ncbi:TetR family transcriptional regulator [Cellulomonas sp. DKR-3]|uniref:TetR family transcriptional regulator n=1 Tax=Cellulomonas fulva TaxID=2835530 RepID=A0ABS5TXF7_9CELL|nr:TetR family transcriptional regulator [Cellulomonas fulva]MBT0993777.1 TetR family transcriptional regulator [Cellulomonas fulva]